MQWLRRPRNRNRFLMSPSWGTTDTKLFSRGQETKSLFLWCPGQTLFFSPFTPSSAIPCSRTPSDNICTVIYSLPTLPVCHLNWSSEQLQEVPRSGICLFLISWVQKLKLDPLISPSITEYQLGEDTDGISWIAILTPDCVFIPSPPCCPSDVPEVHICQQHSIHFDFLIPEVMTFIGKQTWDAMVQLFLSVDSRASFQHIPSLKAKGLMQMAQLAFASKAQGPNYTQNRPGTEWLVH